MKIIMISNFKTFFIAVAFCSSLFSSDFESHISKILKDSLDISSIDMEELEASYSTDPNFLFMTALIDNNGDTALEKFKKLYSQNQSYQYADYAVFEVGSYYYTKGYYVESGKWYKKIPMYYHNSNLLAESINMFFNTLKLTNASDSISYYNNIFHKLYPAFTNKDNISSTTDIVDEEIYDKQYTIQIGAFKEYSGAESRMYMLNSLGFAVRIEELKVDDEFFFIVREGKYSTKKSANKISSRIKARSGLDCMIIEL